MSKHTTLIHHDFGCMVMRCEDCAAKHGAEFGCYADEVERIEDDFSVFCDDCERTIGEREDYR
jgi:hypothetical protein